MLEDHADNILKIKSCWEI